VTYSRVAAVAVACACYLALPLRWSNGQEARDLKTARSDDQTREAINVRILNARRVAGDLHGWQQRVRAVSAAMPPDAEVGSVLAQLRAAASRTRVELTSLSASSSSSPIELDLRVVGDMDTVEQFLTAVRAMPRLLTTTIVSATVSPGSIEVELTSELWSLPGAVPTL
jgi:Tfp pilus assembly protein PilO